MGIHISILANFTKHQATERLELSVRQASKQQLRASAASLCGTLGLDGLDGLVQFERDALSFLALAEEKGLHVALESLWTRVSEFGATKFRLVELP